MTRFQPEIVYYQLLINSLPDSPKKWITNPTINPAIAIYGTVKIPEIVELKCIRY
ncbi:hypothetical protein LEP1GSC073_2544 [Leptospira noguchii str. Cascata]|nr:hypothetical protein LEP1GSC072_3185 [Leptospira noguchii str. Bonito]EMS85547.1 hypothetical protein LEP1GSC073_2544 [Leptospira noguchii str. Cascata]